MFNARKLLDCRTVRCAIFLFGDKNYAYFFKIIENAHEEKLLHCLPNVAEVEELVIGRLNFEFWFFTDYNCNKLTNSSNQLNYALVCCSYNYL